MPLCITHAHLSIRTATQKAALPSLLPYGEVRPQDSALANGRFLSLRQAAGTCYFVLTSSFLLSHPECGQLTPWYPCWAMSLSGVWHGDFHLPSTSHFPRCFYRSTRLAPNTPTSPHQLKPDRSPLYTHY